MNELDREFRSDASGIKKNATDTTVTATQTPPPATKYPSSPEQNAKALTKKFGNYTEESLYASTQRREYFKNFLDEL